MKVAHACVICGSTELTKKIGQFFPFIAHKVADYPICHVRLGDQMMFPPLLTNAIRCRSCGFCFSQLRFDEDEMASLYSGYRGPEYTRTRSIYEPGYERLNPLIGNTPVEIENRQAAVARFFTRLVDLAQMKSVLDHGGDRGQHIPRACEGARRYVYELSDAEPLAGITKISDLQAIGKVDFVMSANVLELVPYPNLLMAEIRQVCTEQTIVFLDVPLEMSPADDLPESEIPAAFHEHINFFTPRSLAALIYHSGFRSLKMEVVEIDEQWRIAVQIFAAARLADG